MQTLKFLRVCINIVWATEEHHPSVPQSPLLSLADPFCTTVGAPPLNHHNVDPGDGDARRAFLRITVAPFFLRRSFCLSSSSYYRRRSEVRTLVPCPRLRAV